MTAMLLESAVEQGFIYALVALALYLSYRVLDIADLTTDGTFDAWVDEATALNATLLEE